MIIIIVYIEVEKWKEDSCFNEYFESFVESTMVRFSGQIRFPQTHARQQFFDPSSLHRFRSRTKWKKKRGYLSRVRNFNRIRPSRGSTSIVFTTTIFHSREPRLAGLASIPQLEENVRTIESRMRLWLVKEETGGHRLRASKNKRDARDRRNRCCVWRRRRRRRGGLCR